MVMDRLSWREKKKEIGPENCQLFVTVSYKVSSSSSSIAGRWPMPVVVVVELVVKVVDK